MKKSMTALAAIAFAGAVGMAQAADISQSAQTVDLSGGSSAFSRVFSSQNMGNTFTDRFDFSIGATSKLSSLVYSFATPPATQGLALTDFALYSSSGPAQAGTKVFDGPLSLWTNTATNLQAANYYLLVSGNVLGNGTSRYDGAITVQAAAVPEPETYGMLLGGLAVLGLVARRRKSDSGA